MKKEGCPKCGSPKRESGKVYQQGTLYDIRFKADSASELSLKKQVAALACQQCGYIELYLYPFDTSGAAPS
jgi:predicted nucleic-acid-binding Zn-ribbon protein